jgi:hypothetical protein
MAELLTTANGPPSRSGRSSGTPCCRPHDAPAWEAVAERSRSAYAEPTNDGSHSSAETFAVLRLRLGRDVRQYWRNAHAFPRAHRPTSQSIVTSIATITIS